MPHTGPYTARPALPGSPGRGDWAVCLDGVAVTVRRTPVLRDLDLRLPTGAVLGVLGANGSGKTTLLRLLATLAVPSSGRAEVLGHELGGPGVPEVRTRIAMVGHLPALYPQLTLAENLHLVARLTGRSDEAADRALAAVGLAGAAARRTEGCSQGMARRADLARVLLVEPSLLLLDEVHAGLDHGAADLVDELVGKVRARGGTCVLVSHEPDRLAGLTDRLVRIVDGRAVPEVTR